MHAAVARVHRNSVLSENSCFTFVTMLELLIDV